MSLPVALTRLRITIRQADRWHGRPLYEAIVERARKNGLAAERVWKGIVGFGVDSRLCDRHALAVSEDLPVLGVAAVQLAVAIIIVASVWVAPFSERFFIPENFSRELRFRRGRFHTTGSAPSNTHDVAALTARRSSSTPRSRTSQFAHRCQNRARTPADRRRACSSLTVPIQTGTPRLRRSRPASFEPALTNRDASTC